MKKTFLYFLNILSTLFCFGSIGLLMFGSPSGNAISYIRQPQYIESSEFETLTGNRIADIFDYIRLTTIFEDENELNLRTIMATAGSGDSSVSYSLDYLIQYARSMGYYFNDKNELVKGSNATITEEDDKLNHRVRVTYRACDPDYQPISPTDGQMSIGDLAVETLQYLSRYYAVKTEFQNNKGNFCFNVTYTCGNDQRIYTNRSSVPGEILRKMGKYVYADSESLEVNTNLNQFPQELVVLLKSRDPFNGEGQYHLSIGIDTSFSAPDAFQRAFEKYTERRSFSIIGVTVFGISALLMLLTLCGIVMLAGTSGKRGDKSISRLHMDSIPVELIICAFFFWTLAADKVAENLIASLENIIGSVDAYHSFIFFFISFMLKYLVFLPLLLSITRNYRADTLWQHSLLRKITALFSHYVQAAVHSSSKAFSYILFVIPNILAAIMITILFYHFFHRQSLNAFAAAVSILFILLAIDYYSWHISTGLKQAVDEQVKSERLKADLITNVSHDLKTPLTSIISYIELMKREQTDNPRLSEYLAVLDQKSKRLKTLTEDLVEASKASSGNVNIEFTSLNYTELVEQALGEFEDKTAAAHLEMILNYPDHPVMIQADGRHLWRVIENLLNNCCKYAMRDSRVYVDISEDPAAGTAACTIKNISSRPLNISPEELTERFVRGDVSRTTEGSGLGLSIAKSLTVLMNGVLDIRIDGDLYKAAVILKLTPADKHN